MFTRTVPFYLKWINEMDVQMFWQSIIAGFFVKVCTCGQLGELRKPHLKRQLKTEPPSNKIKRFIPYFMVNFSCSSNENGLVLVSYSVITEPCHSLPDLSTSCSCILTAIPYRQYARTALWDSCFIKMAPITTIVYLQVGRNTGKKKKVKISITKAGNVRIT